MSNSESKPNNDTADRRAKSRIEEPLREASVSAKRSTRRDQHKASYNHDSKYLPTEIEGGYTVFGGDGLVIFDIDVPIDDLPDWIQDLPPAFVVESPHGGYHLYYLVENDSGISNTGFSWGSIRYEGQYVLGPGSTIDHSDCDEAKENCPDEGTGEYTIEADKPIAALSGKHLEAIREACTSDTDTQVSDHDPIADPDSELVNRGELALHTLQDISTPAFNDLMNFLQGGIPGLDDEDDDRFESEKMFKGDGRIDRDSHDTVALSLLYGTLRDYCDYDHEKAIDIATATYTHYCHEHPWTEDGQKRRWGYEGTEYRRHTITYALNSFDSERFKQLVEKRGAGTRDEDNKYSELTHEAIWTALYDLLPNNPPTLSNDMDPENPTTKARIPEDRMARGKSPLHKRYPGKQEIVDGAYEIDDGYNEWSSYEEAFRRLQSDYGEVKAARIGNDWVYYPAKYPDPPEANYVKQYGEKYDPEEAEGINSWTDEPEQTDAAERDSEENEKEVMTDGGVDVDRPDPTGKLKQIRQARSSTDDSSDDPDILICPVEGCDRVVIDDIANLRHHVRQEVDNSHRGLKLTSEFELVERYKVKSDLRTEYLDNGKTQQEIADEWGVGRNTIHRWLKKHDIDRRDWTGTGAWNRVQRASFYTETNENGGYEKIGAYDPKKDGMVWTTVHQLLAVALGEDPDKVFSNGEFQTHHRTGIPFDNRPENIELLARDEHQRSHRADEWKEENGYPVLVTDYEISEEAYHATWGPGVLESDSTGTTPDENGQEDLWGPGVPS